MQRKFKKKKKKRFRILLDRAENSFSAVFCVSNEFRALFTGLASTLFSKKNFKSKSHSTIYTFKNYFATIFLVFSFQFSVISGIQIDISCDYY